MAKISFTFPYDTGLSKNEQHDFIPLGKKNEWEGLLGVPEQPQNRRMVVNKASATKFMGQIKELARSQCVLLKRKRGREFEPRKIWLRVMVYKPNMKADAINFLDMIADGVKWGIGIDDNVFSAVIDWELVTDGSERIEITVEQEVADV